MEDLTGIFKEDLSNKIMEQHKEDLQHLGTASFAKQTHMIQDSVGSLSTQPSTKFSNVKSTTHAICASKRVNIEQILVHAS